MPTEEFDPFGYVFGEQLGEATPETADDEALERKIEERRKQATPSVAWWVIGGLTLSVLFLDSINNAQKRRR